MATHGRRAVRTAGLPEQVALHILLIHPNKVKACLKCPRDKGPALPWDPGTAVTKWLKQETHYLEIQDEGAGRPGSFQGVKGGRLF